MTNSYDVDHGLSQCPPGPLEPVELAQQPGAAPATGNTARDQEMYAAGIKVGEENAKHNAAIRGCAGWLPIESAPKDGTEIIVFHPKAGVCAAFCPGDGFAWHCMDGMNTAIGKNSGQSIPVMTSFVDAPTHWMPLPAAPGVSKVEDAQAVAWMDPDTRDVISAERKASWLNNYGIGGANKAAAYTRALGDLRPAPAAGDAQTEPMIVLSGQQLLDALEFVAPDRDPLQLECTVAIQFGEGHSGAGHYCWLDDSPDEGAILLRPEPDTTDELESVLDELAAQRKGDA